MKKTEIENRKNEDALDRILAEEQAREEERSNASVFIDEETIKNEEEIEKELLAIELEEFEQLEADKERTEYRARLQEN